MVVNLNVWRSVDEDRPDLHTLRQQYAVLLWVKDGKQMYKVVDDTEYFYVEQERENKRRERLNTLHEHKNKGRV